ncbi:MAG TPA: hypothetical protein VMT88_01555 [Actinomycetes bacterium]|nr:hypothetical protein [Actinomycetes bacterium]
MTDIEHLVKETLRARATDIPEGSSPTLPNNFTARREVNRTHVVLAGAVVAAIVVLGFTVIDGHFLGVNNTADPESLVSIRTGTPPLRCGQHKGRDDAPSPTLQQLSDMPVRAATVCQWTNEEPKIKPHVAISTYFKNYQLTNQVALSQTQAAAVIRELKSATAGTPDCMLIDSAPTRVFSVLLGDEGGARWKIDIPAESCLGFTLGNNKRYTSAGLIEVLASYVTQSFPLPISGWQPGESAELALLTGNVRLDEGCLVAGPPAHPIAVAWPADFTATIDGLGQVQVSNADRSVVATTNERIEAGGASGPTDIEPWKGMTCVDGYNKVFVIQDTMTNEGQ